MVNFRVAPGEGKRWFIGGLISCIASTAYVYYTEQETKKRLKAGLRKDAELIAKKRAQIKEQQDLYEKQLEFNAKMTKLDVEGAKKS